MTKILGAHRSRPTFEQLDPEEWRTAVSEQLAQSGLQKAIKRLVTDMVVSSQRSVLIKDGGQLAKQLRKAIDNQQYVLIFSLHPNPAR